MRVLVCGGRDFDDEDRVTRALAVLSPKDVLVHGAARGADSLAAKVWASRHGLTEAHPADWARYGKGAGPKRNQQMLDSGIDLVLAFPGGSGTEDMVGRAIAAGITVRVV